jgi:hypothetical protein
MQNKLVNGRFHIYTGYKEGAVLKSELQSGEAYEVEEQGRKYYLMKMWALPRECYYLCANQNSDGFTLFAKKVESEKGITFRRPVGFGFISRELTKHLEVQFTFPRQRVFMSLFPDKVTIDSLIEDDGGVA